MKKILYFNHTSFIGGAGWCLYQLVKALPKGVVEPVVVLPVEGDLSQAFRNQGVRVILEPAILPLMGNSNSSGFWSLSNFRFFVAQRRGRKACQRLCGEETPDMVHLNSSVLFHLAGGAKKAGVKKVILHVREHWAVKKWDPREWLKQRKVSQYIDEIIAISQTSARLFGYEYKTTVVYDWPDFAGRDEPVDMEVEYGISPEKQVILVLGGRSEIKGSLVALRAMKTIREEKALMLLLGGKGVGGNAKACIRKILKILNVKTYGLQLDEVAESLGDRVRVVSASRNIKSLIEQSCMVVSPFTTPHFSMPSMEAGVLKKPIVISDNGHARETVLDEQSGLIVEPGDVRVLAQALRRLLSDPVQRQKMGDAGFAHVTSHFCRETSIMNLISVYKRSKGDDHVH